VGSRRRDVVASLVQSLVVIRGRGRPFQFLAHADLHPSDYATAGDTGAWAASYPMVLVGAPGYGLSKRGRSGAVGLG
jgi:hypothetical protein